MVIAPRFISRDAPVVQAPSVPPSQHEPTAAPEAKPRLALPDFVSRHYLPAKPGTRPASIENITSSINLLRLWAKREVFADELNRDLLMQFRAWRLQERTIPCCTRHRRPMYWVRGTEYRCHMKGCPEKVHHAKAVAPATANKDVRTLTAIWREAIEHGDNLHQFKKIPKLKEDLDNQEAWTLEEFGRILASCRLQPEEMFLPCRMNDMCLALAWVLYDVASRISAVMNSRPSDFDRQSGTLTLRSGVKKDRKCQVFPLSSEALAALAAIYDPANEYLFPWPHDRTRRGWPALTDRWKEILRRAGLKCGKKDLFHKIRRTTATQLVIASGMEAAKQHLGHSHESVTKRYVDQRQLDNTQSALQKLPRPKIE